ncbi:MAG: phosphopantetheine-binding protein, partial [Bifidobacteriaceae bacterium]|jgi:hypothetical protein|nr:phosphopantetheine-binding protein [Bifidobacteriaceae bacterium]
MPLNPSGKIDKHALLALRHTPHLDHVPPATPAEQQVLDILRDALGTPDAGVTDDFFELGGDSLTAIRIVTKLAAVGLTTTVREIFSGRTARHIATTATRAAQQGADGDAGRRPSVAPVGPAAPSAAPGPVPDARLLGATLAAADAYGRRLAESRPVGELPLSPANRVTAELGIRASGALLYLPGQLDPGHLASVWNRILDQHAILRSRLDSAAGRLVLTAPAPMGAVDLPIVQAASKADADLLGATLLGPSNFYGNRPADPAPPSHRLVVLTYPGGATLVLQASHFVLDAFSTDVLKAAVHGTDPATASGGARPLGYAEYLDFLARGPVTSDAEAYAALGLAEFERAAAAYGGLPRAPRTETPEYLPAGTGAVHDTARAIGRRLLAESGGRPVPLLVVTPGRVFRDADFNDAVGEFVDLLPCVITTQQPDPLQDVAPAQAFARAHDLVCNALAYPPASASFGPEPRLPDTARVLRRAIASPNVPILNLVIGDQGAAATTLTLPGPDASDDASAQRARLVNATISGDTVIVHHLPQPAPAAPAAPVLTAAATPS